MNNLDLTQLNLSELSEAHLKFKEKVAEIEAASEKRIKELNEQIDKFMAEIELRLKNQGLDSIKLPAGTYYHITKTRVSKKDGEAFLNFIKDNDRFDLATIQPGKVACVAYIKETDIVPDGVEYMSWKELQFKKG